MRSFSNHALTILLLLTVAKNTWAALPMCSSVGVYLCFDTANDLCDTYCKNNGGGAKSSCEVLNNSLQVDCQCTTADTGCIDTSYVSSAIPTCTDFEIYSCNNACTDLCLGLKKSNGQGRAATCNAPSGKTKCMCDGLPVCDDAINDAPATSPAQSPTADSAAYHGGSNPLFAIMTLSLVMGMMNLIN
ncbi:MAG: hypothetical protein SGBAC_011160 [Bacillariaceae sp.]